VALEEPTISELIRRMADQLTRIDGMITSFVTQEQRASDQALTNKRLDDLETDVKGLSDARENDRRQKWTSLAAPLIVGVVLWLLTSGVIGK
jgi:hypothetical protein